jgi:hypothetical protein
MPADRREEPQQVGDNQLEQESLVEQAQKIPGVAEAIEVYSRVAPYAGLVAYSPAVQIRFATGGNVDAHLGGAPR